MTEIMPLLKTINGKRYELLVSYFSEKTAKRVASAYRSGDWNARVVSFDKDTSVATASGSRRAGRKIYGVYVSKERRR